MSRKEVMNARQEYVAGTGHSDHRLYELLGERERLLDEHYYLAARVEGDDEQLRHAREIQKPRRVDSLAEYDDYRRHLQALEELSRDSEQIRDRLQEIDARLREIPETLLNEGMIPEGLWVGHGCSDIRVDRSPSGEAHISEASSKAVRTAESADPESVRAREAELGSPAFIRLWRAALHRLGAEPSWLDREKLRQAADPSLVIGGMMFMLVSISVTQSLVMALALPFLIGFGVITVVHALHKRTMKAAQTLFAGVVFWVMALISPWVMELVWAAISMVKT